MVHILSSRSSRVDSTSTCTNSNAVKCKIKVAYPLPVSPVPNAVSNMTASQVAYPLPIMELVAIHNFAAVLLYHVH
jgi:hypothetical protein